uniref:Uncharacterized protein n=1 Tax=Oryza meridionalis TaxID=40149 RepID=A0A0E0EGQ9_9ORYZ
MCARMLRVRCTERGRVAATMVCTVQSPGDSHGASATPACWEVAYSVESISFEETKTKASATE